MEITAASRLGFSSVEQESQTQESTMHDEFLRMLVAQIENQDPLEPQDGTEFVAQLAQFASLEQTAETNTRLSQLQALQTAQLKSGFSNLAGRTVRVGASELNYPAEFQETTLGVSVNEEASSVAVHIVDAQGNTVRKIHLGGAAAGFHEFEWDGKDEEGNAVSEGAYQLSVDALDSAGQKIAATVQREDVVRGVDFTESDVRFAFAQGYISPSDISWVK